MNKISQREARRLKKRVEQLEQSQRQQQRAWASEWPGGVNVSTLTVSDTSFKAIEVSRMLGHAVVVTLGARNELKFMAVKNNA